MTTMSSHNISKINQLIRHWPRGTVAVQPWLEKQGVYRQLADRYQQNGWLERIGYGAYIQTGDAVDWTGAMYALQFESGLQLNIAALTALEMQGYAHFLPLGKGHAIWLFKNVEEKNSLPRWFKKQFGIERPFKIMVRRLFDANWQLGLKEKTIGEYKVILSSPERAIMEYFDLVPQQQSLEHGFLLMEGLQTLRPKLVQELLENCTSVKVKRLFMSLAEKQGHPWVNKLDLTKVNFGSGKRMIGKGGKLDTKYNLSLPIITTEENEDDK